MRPQCGPSGNCTGSAAHLNLSPGDLAGLCGAAARDGRGPPSPRPSPPRRGRALSTHRYLPSPDASMQP
jgi:hypothetical protein